LADTIIMIPVEFRNRNEFEKKREKYLKELLDLAPNDLKIQLYEIKNGEVFYNESLEAIYYKLNPSLFSSLVKEDFNRRKIFDLNKGIFEIVFDIDIKANDVSENEKNEFLNKVVEKLKSLRITKFYVWHSGNVGYHIHMFFEIKNLEEIQNYQPEEIQNYIIEHFKKIAEDLNKTTSRIQIETKQLSFNEWIRLEGSINPKSGKRKLCLIDGKLTFPESIELNEFVIDKNEIERKREEIRKQYEKVKNVNHFGGKTIWWIEELLQTPLSDGRERVVNLILAPYLVNYKNYDFETAKTIILNWLNESNKLRPLKSKLKESYVIYQLKYAKEKGLKPLSLQRALSEKLSDVKEFVEKFSNLRALRFKKLKDVYDVVSKDIEQIKNFEDFILSELKYYIYDVEKIPYHLLKILYLVYKNMNKLNGSKILDFEVNVGDFENALGFRFVGMFTLRYEKLKTLFFRYGKNFENGYKRRISEIVLDAKINNFVEKLIQLGKFKRVDLINLDKEIQIFKRESKVIKFYDECRGLGYFKQESKKFYVVDVSKIEEIKRIIKNVIKHEWGKKR